MPQPRMNPWLPEGALGWLTFAPNPLVDAPGTVIGQDVAAEEREEPPRPIARPPPWHGENGDAILASIDRGLSLDVICAIHEIPPWAARCVAFVYHRSIGPRAGSELARLTAERDRLLEEIEEARARS